MAGHPIVHFRREAMTPREERRLIFREGRQTDSLGRETGFNSPPALRARSARRDPTLAATLLFLFPRPKILYAVGRERRRATPMIETILMIKERTYCWQITPAH